MAEYGVVLAVITIGCVGAMTLLGGNVVNALTRVTGHIGLAPPGKVRHRLRASGRRPAVGLPVP